MCAARTDCRAETFSPSGGPRQHRGDGVGNRTGHRPADQLLDFSAADRFKGETRRVPAQEHGTDPPGPARRLQEPPARAEDAGEARQRCESITCRSTGILPETSGRQHPDDSDDGGGGDSHTDSEGRTGRDQPHQEPAARLYGPHHKGRNLLCHAGTSLFGRPRLCPPGRRAGLYGTGHARPCICRCRLQPYRSEEGFEGGGK